MPAPVQYHTRRRSTSPPPAPPAICRTCKETFSSRNALFSHLRKMFHYLRSTIRSILRPIVASKAQRRKVGTGTAFKDFSYCEVRYQFSYTSSDAWGCADTGSGMSLVDESVLESGALYLVKGLSNRLSMSKGLEMRCICRRNPWSWMSSSLTSPTLALRKFGVSFTL